MAPGADGVQGEARIDLAVERGDRSPHAGSRRNHDCQVAVVRGEPVGPARLDGTVVGDVPVHGVHFGVGGVDLDQGDVAVHGLDGDVTDRVGNGDVAFDRVHLDTALGLGECHTSLDRLQIDVARAAGDLDVALHRFRGHGPAGAVHADVGVRPAQVHAHPRGDGDLQVDDGRWTPAAFAPDHHRAGRGRDLDAARAGMAGAHPDVVLMPRPHHDLAAKVVDVEPGALLHGNRRVAVPLRTARS